jgi:hypothetical protein
MWSSYNLQGHLSVMRHESREACMTYCAKTGDVPLSPDNHTLATKKEK